MKLRDNIYFLAIIKAFPNQFLSPVPAGGIMSTPFDPIYAVVTRCRVPNVVPLYEHFADDPIIEKIMGYDFSTIDSSQRDGQLALWEKRIAFYQQMGYGYVPVELGPLFAPRPSLISEDTALYAHRSRGWVDEHGGSIASLADLENPAYWPTGDKAFDYAMFDDIARLVPEGMKIIGGASGGPFEHASFLMGLEPLSLAMYDDPPFVERLFEQIGKTLVEIAARLVKVEQLGIYRFGDDMGYKTATMLSPAQLRKYVFPWSKKVVEAVHQAGKPFLLHSCGQLERVMDDLIDDVKIDAKHSFEDVIMPVTEAKRRWGDRICLLGGIDLDFLCRHSPAEIMEYTKRVMDFCSRGGGYAVGTGNTVTNYVPVENYLAMLKAAADFNGRPPV
jgi:uroporphyrinogen decarboxylase